VSHLELGALLSVGMTLGLILYYDIRMQVRMTIRRQKLVLLTLLEITETNGLQMSPETRHEIKDELKQALKG